MYCRQKARLACFSAYSHAERYLDSAPRCYIWIRASVVGASSPTCKTRTSLHSLPVPSGARRVKAAHELYVVVESIIAPSIPLATAQPLIWLLCLRSNEIRRQANVSARGWH